MRRASARQAGGQHLLAPRPDHLSGRQQQHGHHQPADKKWCI
ncbi:MAG TPA: hypothetical protein VJL59_25470 [Anaerolineales bacterium]|nr:hypothetical protein [Anaerolineales bacterium]